MKRYFVLAAAIGLLAGVGAQTWADCTVGSNGTTACCRWSATNCWGIGGTYDDMKTEGDCLDNYGDVVTSCTDNGIKDEYCNYGTCVNGDGWNCETGGCFAITASNPCKTGGEVVSTCPDGTLPPAAGGTPGGGGGGGGGAGAECEAYCKWGTSCSPIHTVPEATETEPTVLATCAEAVDNCLAYSPSHATYSDAACTSIKDQSGIENCGKYCKWEVGGCNEIRTVPVETPDNPTVLATCAEAIANCAYSPSGTAYDDANCTVPSTGVKLLANKAKTPGLKVSYAKNRVTVNWTPSAKLSSGTIQLINAKGAVLSTAFIKANSGKVTAKLGTSGVPAGMYFVHINAVGQNGKKIVTQSAVSIVK